MTAPKSESALFKEALLDTIIPDDTTASITDLLNTSGEHEELDDTSLLQIKQRKLLFYDERLTVYVLLQIPSIPEELLKSYLARLDIKLEVWALSRGLNGKQPEALSEGPGSASDLILSLPVKKTDDPIIMVKGDDNAGDGEVSMLVLWEATVILSRPRARFQNPAISLIASAALSPGEVTDELSILDYLPSFQPVEYNILEPLQSMKGLKGSHPVLAASRLERVLPRVPNETTSISIRHVTPRSTPIVPAISARMRFTRAAPLSGSPEPIASLDFEVTPFVCLKVLLENVQVILQGGGAEELMPVDLPLACISKDCITFMYKLHPRHTGAAPGLPLTIVSPAGNSTGTISIVIHAKVTVSAVCTSSIQIEWSTNIDFLQALNPSFGPPGGLIQRQKRPNSLPISQQPSGTITPRSSTTALGSGLAISFTASDTPVIVGKPFIWQVVVVNRSPKPAKLAIIPLPRIQRVTSVSQQYSKRHAPKSSNASFNPSERRHTRAGEDVDVAQAISDENIVYAIQHSNASPPDMNLLSMTAELRIGPLGPGTSHESEIRMVALEKGALRVDAIRVVDLTKETEDGAGLITDIRDLPDVLAVDDDEVRN